MSLIHLSWLPRSLADYIRTSANVQDIPQCVSSYQANHLDIPLLKLIFQFGECTELRRTDWGEVGRVREQDRPFPAKPLVKVYVSLSSLCGEVRCFRPESKAWLLGGCCEESFEDR